MATLPSITEFFPFLERLRAAGVPFELASPREGTLLVRIVRPGERFEAEFCANSTEVHVEILRGDGSVQGRAALEKLLTQVEREAQEAMDEQGPA